MAARRREAVCDVLGVGMAGGYSSDPRRTTVAAERARYDLVNTCVARRALVGTESQSALR